MTYVLIIGGIFLIDYLIKNRIERSVEKGEKLYFCGEKLIITNFHNKGAILGFLKNHQEIVKIISGIVTVIVAIYLLVHLRKKNGSLTKVGSAMVLGGGLSNTYDRFVRKYVVDYVSFGVKWQKFRRIVFNCSDFCIFIGSFLYCIGKKKS